MHRLALCLILISSTPLSETIIDQARRNRAIHSPAAPTLHEDSHGMHAQVALEYGFRIINSGGIESPEDISPGTLWYAREPHVPSIHM